MNVRRSCTTAIMRKFGLKLFLDTVQRLRVTDLLIAPPVALMLTKSDLTSQYDLSSVERLLCGAAPLQPEMSKKLEAIFNGKVHARQGWGMTEATMAVTLFTPDECDASHRGVGYLVPNMELRIVKDDGQVAGYREEGEAQIRGPNVFKGYYKNLEASQDICSEGGWLKTGDIVTMQESGLLTIVDRKKELIKVKGFQVSPSEIEGVLLEHEHVKDCAVVRVIREGQEHPQAYIVASDKKVTTESIMAFLDARLSVYKRLTGGVVFVDAIPKSPSGKILRRMLHRSASKELAHL
ncbi:4-coumarate ligase [Fusarium pseudocircinatum]|uniref:4-coumarate ligase n=1 Tax=Fusarium pseudocircinatum TaxID=56676 RepID=A0A8H5NQ64_9HYPO|nr:4-coumarate ligase [Fusarium pseudocircinatum]